MKISLVALVAVSSLAGAAVAAFDNPPTNPPNLAAFDNPPTNPPNLAAFDNPPTNPPNLS
jgi:hypothetical protein